ncbi:UDP-N-acetylmuramoyl-tripeptide--D-alanyl-D-alanine ligase [Vibrio gazogenes]|uniref:UDP-N-acetylmuramoyl-tripeptide--D-alanyl-D-alanine ligase n=1 Tax=Vibrio gazogenes DSM 21264 = NBRC 103151 TaxID=1123492 RepID=A0A1M4WRF9_VIBGA|nr:UDP-N-acetylmuramoyl-tripeptide--D-alanyl-D-alanine ligase [Vibrio gazogenes]USP13156.1 UDP-N-acetylmuramoyl-tripeptide--D-alanyl-D-alanine ligase [Vibrio gazogenes]SHE83562.1 UDP-N-acetylmuramoyl-tripeptide--D-alanyl-D-alanine ligase [Vibrio gazogenes DSM 21264] [Vibrio gazogenes DSM 21264 = NBRC 103151]SJN55292.1 UDP-N-acetylmuramoyl-tripeptide--D-alanyl-D-alanine ligase [Vibrio gazogenes]
MIQVSLSQLANILEAELIGEDLYIHAISTDTRHIDKGALFIALVGERFDAHDFADQAIAQGAQALLVSRALKVNVPQIIVRDTCQALGTVAAWVHQQCQTKTVAITGSCGKTTVKEMVAAILAQKGRVLYTQGNFNNEIGVPLTLLRSCPEDDFAIIELGANHVGEIAYTTRLVKPDAALVNNVAASHLEGFGSLEGVRVAKGEIFEGLIPGATAVINLDSQGNALWEKVLADKHVVTFSRQQMSADFYAQSVHLDASARPSFTLVSPQGQRDVQLNIIGEHNITNALAAAALATAAGATLDEIKDGLENAKNVQGRVDVSILTPKIRLIDDSYNASVPAVKSAIDLLATFSAVRWLVLGNMAELGDESLALHRQVGEHAAPCGFDYVLTYGDDAKVISEVCQGVHFSSHQHMMEYIERQLDNDQNQEHVLLVKGAHSAGMGNIVAALKEKYA